MVSAANNQQGFEDDDEEEQEQEESRQQAWDQPTVLVVAHQMLLEIMAMLEMDFQESSTPKMMMKV
jgi:hypothetical protein